MTLTYSLLIISFLSSTVSNAQTPTVKIGIYNFVENTASELYKLRVVLSMILIILNYI
jgi:uncharacterized protein YbbC (DUF1343 family)